MPRLPIIQLPCSSEQLIEEVRKRPGLWRIENANERQSRKHLWVDVAKSLDPNWDKLNKHEARELESNIRRRWRSIRDSYKRERREQYINEKRGKQKSQFVYFDQMSFVDEHVDYKYETKMEGNDSKYDEDPMHGETSTIEIEVPMKKPKRTRISKYKYTKREPATEENEIPNITVTETRISKQKYIKTEPAAEENEIQSKKPCISKQKYLKIEPATEENAIPNITVTDSVNLNLDEEEFDNDKMFMLSFLPELKSLPLNLKMWARMKISRVMQEAVSLNMVQTPDLKGYSDSESN